MKKLIIGVAISALLALPACAKTHQPPESPVSILSTSDPITTPEPISIPDIETLLKKGDDGDSYPPVVCGRPCVIEESEGGAVDLFKAEARELHEEGAKIIVDGPCYSSCTIFVDINHENVCITSNAIFGYHKSSIQDHPGHYLKKFDLKYETPGLEAYIKSKGGLPDPEDGEMLTVTFSEAQQFYKKCAGD